MLCTIRFLQCRRNEINTGYITELNSSTAVQIVDYIINRCTIMVMVKLAMFQVDVLSVLL